MAMEKDKYKKIKEWESNKKQVKKMSYRKLTLVENEKNVARVVRKWLQMAFVITRKELYITKVRNKALKMIKTVQIPLVDDNKNIIEKDTTIHSVNAILGNARKSGQKNLEM
ncbi:hypothetical protein HK096_001403, partial [Nowakowskiella sp. JEL0078]